MNSDFEDATISPWEVTEGDTDAINKKSDEHAHSGKFGELIVERTGVFPAKHLFGRS